MATQASGKRMSAKQHEAKRKRKIIIFAVEILIILIMIAVLWMVMTKTSSGPKVTVLDPKELEIPREIQQEKEEGGSMHGYLNIALFGLDATTDKQLYKGSRSDSTMIASINLDTGEIKLVSVYRDTYLYIAQGTPDELDSKGRLKNFSKCNAAYSIGGAEQAVKMLNTNLDMDIEHFITVGYKGLSEVIDGLGGVWIDVDEVELKHINNYQISIMKDVFNSDKYDPVTETGYQLLNGIQAAAYCRIRYGGGDDYLRATRQREVIKAIEEQAKKADLVTLTKVFNEAIDDIYTNVDTDVITEFLGSITKYKIVDEGGFPNENMRTAANLGAKQSCIVPINLESNVVWLHQFLFDDANYTVTDSVHLYDELIASDTAKYINK